MQNEQNDRTSDKTSAATSEKKRSTRRDIPAAAQRALAEAEERRKVAAAPALEREIGGRGGKDPVRYGDWEIKGRAIDF